MHQKGKLKSNRNYKYYDKAYSTKYTKNILQNILRFSEDIYDLICRGNINEVNGALKDMMTYKMTIILNVLSTLMKDIIMSNLHSTVIVTMKWCSR